MLTWELKLFLTVGTNIYILATEWSSHSYSPSDSHTLRLRCKQTHTLWTLHVDVMSLWQTTNKQMSFFPLTVKWLLPPPILLSKASTHQLGGEWSGTTQVQQKGLVFVVWDFFSLFLELYRSHGCSTCCLTVKRSPGGAAEFLPSIYGKREISQRASVNKHTQHTSQLEPPHWSV